MVTKERTKFVVDTINSVLASGDTLLTLADKSLRHRQSFFLLSACLCMVGVGEEMLHLGEKKVEEIFEVSIPGIVRSS